MPRVQSREGRDGAVATDGQEPRFDSRGRSSLIALAVGRLQSMSMAKLIPYLEAVFVFGTEYELSTLNMIRKRLFLQSEEAGRCTIEWGRRASGHLKKTIFIDVRGASLGGNCDEAVKDALNEFRPLAFALAFKVQDVLAEVVLEASGTKDARNLTFGAKRKQIERLRTSGGLSEPDVLARHRKIGDAWWNLYFDMEPFRGAIHHTGLLLRGADGGLEIVTARPKRLGDRLVLSAAEQGSYVRIACLVAEGVTQYDSFDALQRRLVANDVAALEHLHRIGGASEGPARLALVKLLVAEEFAQSRSPFVCGIDFDEVASAAGTPLIDLDVEATVGERRLSWSIPADSYPKGTRILREGNPDFEQWRTS